jgi:hypothetical protein
MSNFWSEQLPTPIFLEWTAVHSIFFGVDTFALQNVRVHVVKVWSAFSLTHNKSSLLTMKKKSYTHQQGN